MNDLAADAHALLSALGEQFKRQIGANAGLAKAVGLQPN
jgi:hypothetical protein